MRICPNGHVAEGRTCRECHRANYHKHKVLKHTHGRDKTHCKRGHEFTPENTRIGIRGNHKYRACRACANMHSKNNHKIYKYGMTTSQLNALFVAQGSCCDACKTKKPGRKGWQTDHNHTTGVVRGILCQQCNLALGQAKDSVEILQSLIEYLRRTSHVVNSQNFRHDGVGEEVFVQPPISNR